MDAFPKYPKYHNIVEEIIIHKVDLDYITILSEGFYLFPSDNKCFSGH